MPSALPADLRNGTRHGRRHGRRRPACRVCAEAGRISRGGPGGSGEDPGSGLGHRCGGGLEEVLGDEKPQLGPAGGGVDLGGEALADEGAQADGLR